MKTYQKVIIDFIRNSYVIFSEVFIHKIHAFCAEEDEYFTTMFKTSDKSKIFCEFF
jgi:hypothetical protein